MLRWSMKRNAAFRKVSCHCSTSPSEIAEPLVGPPEVPSTRFLRHLVLLTMIWQARLRYGAVRQTSSSQHHESLFVGNNLCGRILGNWDPVENKIYIKLSNFTWNLFQNTDNTPGFLSPLRTLTINMLWVCPANGTKSAEMWSELGKVSKNRMLQIIRLSKIFLLLCCNIFSKCLQLCELNLC